MTRQGKIVVDKDIPYIEAVLEPWFEVEYLPADGINHSCVKDALAVVVRTRTRCDASLLEGSAVSLVATATIGTDHIDTLWCAQHGIGVASAPGCNSAAVCQYVFAALDALGEGPLGAGGILRTLGIVGVGHVGSRVAAEGRRRGYRVLENDPPRGLPLPLDGLLAESDIVTLHIPLEGNADFADERFFKRMKRGAAFINASRGDVVVEQALLEAKRSGSVGKMAIDVWRNEPHLNMSLLEAADIATPHIAGYSVEGKMNGTQMAVRAVGRHFGIEELARISIAELFPVKKSSGQYDILADDAALRSAPLSFESLRSHYNFR